MKYITRNIEKKLSETCHDHTNYMEIIVSFIIYYYNGWKSILKGQKLIKIYTHTAWYNL